MRRINVQHHVTCVIVTNDLDCGDETDRVIRLNDGKVVSDETTAPEAMGV